MKATLLSVAAATVCASAALGNAGARRDHRVLQRNTNEKRNSKAKMAKTTTVEPTTLSVEGFTFSQCNNGVPVCKPCGRDTAEYNGVNQ